MVAEANRTSAASPRRSWIADRLRNGPPVPRIIRKLLGSLRRATTSSLTRRIVILNLAALVALAGGILYLNKFRAGLIDTRVESLLTQGQIIAAAIAAQASVDTDAITIDPDKLLRAAGRPERLALQCRRGGGRFSDQPGTRRAAPAAADLSHAHARPYLRSRRHADPRLARPLYARPDPELRFAAPRRHKAVTQRWWDAVRLWYRSGELPVYEEVGSKTGASIPRSLRR